MALDMRGVAIQLNDDVAKGISLNQGGSAGIQLCKVTKLKDGKVYLDGANRPMLYADRLLVVKL